MMLRIFIAILFLFGMVQSVSSQGSMLPLGNRAYEIMDRVDILSDEASFHTAIKYYDRKQMFDFSMANDSLLTRDERQYLRMDNSEYLSIEDQEQQYSKPILKYFYENRANFYEVNKPNFFLRVNPILNVKYGLSARADSSTFTNLRGLEIRGGIDNKVFFYTNILETQARLPDYVRGFRDKFLAIPGQGFYKTFNSNFIDLNNSNDFLNAQGYLSYNASKHFGIQLGHGKNFVGNGIRSLFLSDFSNNYFYLKFNTKIWKFHYQNIFAEIAPIADLDTINGGLIPKKYFAAHYLSFNLTKNLSFGIFESIVFTRENYFEFQYLNPIILYRTVEQLIGSQDNVLLGVDFKWNVKNKASFYGQLIFDEFIYEELFLERRGFWANKYGLQLGVKYIDPLSIKNLDLVVEWNSVRPYTYSHRITFGEYSHYKQSIAHPIGANFTEFIFRANYRPRDNIHIQPSFYIINVGEDDDRNFGNNILLPSNTRVDDFNNKIGQGISSNIFLANINMSYELFHNGFIDADIIYRTKKSEEPSNDLNSFYFNLGFRMNISRFNFSF